MEHIYEKHHDCDQEHCDVCDGGLSICTVCGGAEGTLTKECQGRMMSNEEQAAVYAGQIDYVAGRWITLVKQSEFRQWYQHNNIRSFYGANVEMAHVAYVAGLERAAVLMEERNLHRAAADIRDMIK